MKITNSTYINDIILYKGKIVKSDSFDNTLDEICSNGYIVLNR